MHLFRRQTTFLRFRIIGHWLLLTLSVYAGFFFLGTFFKAEKVQTQGIDCRDGYAIRLSEDDRHPGRYVLCEEYDTYQELVETDQILAAHRLTHEIERTYGDGN